MKQGRASHSGMGSTKTEPVSRAVPPAAPAHMGIMRGNHADTGTIRLQSIPMYEGRGLKAPMAGSTTHKAGSQGTHK